VDRVTAWHETIEVEHDYLAYDQVARLVKFTASYRKLEHVANSCEKFTFTGAIL
jgi:hypothetical protein